MSITSVPASALLHLILLGGVAGLAAAQGQVFIVDQQMRPGSQFADLPQAVAAVPNGSALVVRVGSYSAFTLTGKGLTIAGEDVDGVRIERAASGGGFSLNMVLEATSSSQPILIRNLTISTVSPVIRDCEGPVVLENVKRSAGPFPLGGLRVERSANAQLHACDIEAEFSRPAIHAVDSVLQLSHSTLRPQPCPTCGGGGGGHALDLTRSRCVAFASTLRGDDGQWGCCGFAHCVVPVGSPGGDGVRATDNSTFYAHGCTVNGGRGGITAEPAGGSCGGPFIGGAGIRLGNGSNAVFEGSGPVGGPGRAGGPAGPPFSVSGGSTLQHVPGVVSSTGQIQGTMARGQTIQFTLQAAPGSFAVLVLASDGTLTPVEPLANGSFLMRFRSSFGPGVVPASGLAQLSFAIPALFPLAAVFHGQFVTLESGVGSIRVSNAFTLNVNS